MFLSSPVMKKVMTQKRKRRGAENGISDSTPANPNAEGRKRAKLFCLKRIGRPFIVIGSSENATSALKRLREGKEMQEKGKKKGQESFGFLLPATFRLTFRLSLKKIID